MEKPDREPAAASTGSRLLCLDLLASGVEVDCWDRLASRLVSTWLDFFASGVGVGLLGNSCAIAISDDAKTSKADARNTNTGSVNNLLTISLLEGDANL